MSIQKADLWKRASAALFDFIMLCILVVGFAFMISALVGYDKRIERLETVYEKYEEKRESVRKVRSQAAILIL